MGINPPFKKHIFNSLDPEKSGLFHLFVPIKILYSKNNLPSHPNLSIFCSQNILFPNWLFIEISLHLHYYYKNDRYERKNDRHNNPCDDNNSLYRLVFCRWHILFGPIRSVHFSVSSIQLHFNQKEELAWRRNSLQPH